MNEYSATLNFTGKHESNGLMNEPVINTQRFLRSYELKAWEARIDKEIQAYLKNAPTIPEGENTSPPWSTDPLLPHKE